ncbi:siderophore-interacting protein [Xinfangfangia sp. D13-10-4-6]|uniref:siderophore-interacting protein n=1 Tax=Pseudogemmobacter hezensis TaxID=2737662 RepID=UPI001556362B|nr:siderophore-interacting protein [Pseudogemmobacter hezensis]NPD16971.1 siderophore-interacting protein [Pseudogemmobacter hezensis]
MQLLRDYLSEEMTAAGLPPEWEGHRSPGRPDSHALARVVSVRQISPSYYRVEVGGAELARFAVGGFHFRLLLGPKDAPWPMTDSNGVTQWPGGLAAWHRPVYTTRLLQITPDGARLSFDVFIHEGGRVTEWCRTVQPGAEIVLVGPSGTGGRSGAAWQGFVGDETALPIIARLLEELPDTVRGQAILVVPTAQDIQPLKHPGGVQLTWVFREQGGTPGSAINMLKIPEIASQSAAEHAVFFAAGATDAPDARKALLAHGLTKAGITAAAYWS